MKTLFTAAALLFIMVSSQAQLFQNYYYDYKLLNPALAGSQDKHIITTVYSGFPSRDYSSLFYGSYETSIPKIKSGVGALVYHENYGAVGNLGAGIFYSKQIPFNDHSGLRAGTLLNYRRREIHYSRLDPMGHDEDPSIENPSITHVVNLDLGVWYYSKVVNVGIGVNDFFRSEDQGRNDIWSVIISRDFKIGNALKIKPSLVGLSNQRLNKHGVDINNVIEIKQWIIVGAGYMVWDGGDALNVSAGLNVKEWVQVIGHVYSSWNDGFRKDTDGQVEVIVRANIPHRKKKTSTD